MSNLYLVPHQARTREPTAYENLLGDSLERAFNADIVELEGLVAYLNDHGPQPQESSHHWTAEMLCVELRRLGTE